MRDADHDLIAALHQLSKKQSKLVRSSTHPAPADPDVTIRSWKMNEFKYYDVPSPFPTLARGLFTRWEGSGSEGHGEGKYSIVARGYDKFFNIGEVPWTNWNALEAHTVAPYVLTLKSNGCIIFIAPLTPSKLLITSKHSLGPIQGTEQSHAQAGERWLHKHLEKAGKTEEQLAKALWDENLTAVAELCDDSFEEHVLPYSAELTGLHLHGLNTRTGAFQTRDPAAVDAFAREWGFIPTVFTSFDTVAEVREFTERISKTGQWDGQAIEGFVVRTHIADTPDVPASSDELLNVNAEKMSGRKAQSHTKNRSHGRDAPPYPPSSSFFFKVKFDEPYMMYRDWREITKSLLSRGSEAKIPKAKLNRPETRVYKEWVEKEIKKDKAQFEGFTKGRGIIATRERFLAWCANGEGEKKMDKEMGGSGNKRKREGEEQDGVEVEAEKNFEKTVIVPVAIPGCGKTSVAVALSYLFGFGHTQSDDVKAKKPAPVFLKNVSDLLKTHDVVIADKNNHRNLHRHSLRQSLSNISPPVRLIALNWSLAHIPPATVHRLCSDRIASRGTNHQSLLADPSPSKAHESVLWMFINQTEGLSENEVDEIIEMDATEDLETSLGRAIEGVVRLIGVERPSEEKVREAWGVAVRYEAQGEDTGKGKGRKSDRNEKKKGKDKGKGRDTQSSSARDPRYFGLLPELDLDVLLDGPLTTLDASHPAREFWEHLKKKGRVTKRPHVTVVHSKSLGDPGAKSAERKVWEKCVAVSGAEVPIDFGFRLGDVVCDGRVMAVTVEDVRVLSKEEGEGEGEGEGALRIGQKFLETLPEEIVRRLHITVGTRDGGVNPVEAKTMIEEWRKGGRDTGEAGKEEKDAVTSVPLEDVKGQGRLKGLDS